MPPHASEILEDKDALGHGSYPRGAGATHAALRAHNWKALGGGTKDEATYVHPGGNPLSKVQVKAGGAWMHLHPRGPTGFQPEATRGNTAGQLAAHLEQFHGTARTRQESDMTLQEALSIRHGGALSCEALSAACQDELDEAWEAERGEGSLSPNRVLATFDDCFLYRDADDTLWRQDYHMVGAEVTFDGDPVQTELADHDAPPDVEGGYAGGAGGGEAEPAGDQSDMGEDTFAEDKDALGHGSYPRGVTAPQKAAHDALSEHGFVPVRTDNPIRSARNPSKIFAQYTHPANTASKEHSVQVSPAGKWEHLIRSSTQPLQVYRGSTANQLKSHLSMQQLGEADFSADERKALAKSGAAMPDGSFPIRNAADLENAVRALGRASDPAAAKAHIRKRAAALGLTKSLPDSYQEGVLTEDVEILSEIGWTDEARAAALIARRAGYKGSSAMKPKQAAQFQVLRHPHGPYLEIHKAGNWSHADTTGAARRAGESSLVHGRGTTDLVGRLNLVHGTALREADLQEGRFTKALTAHGFAPSGGSGMPGKPMAFAHPAGHSAMVHSDAKGRERAMQVTHAGGQARFVHAGDSASRVGKILARVTGKRPMATAEAALAEAADLIEYALPGALGASKLDRDAGVIRGTVLLGPVSSNGVNRKRYYSDKARRQIVEMANAAGGLPAYANHVAPDLAFKPRDVRDLIGVHKNVRLDPTTGKVVSDLHLTETQAPWVLALADRLGDRVGNSLVSRGLVRMDGDSEVVDEMQQLRSCDLVSDPATTKGLFESASGDGIDVDACRALAEAQAKGSRVQTLIFPKEHWEGADAAKAWASQNGFTGDKVDKTGSSFRLRQAEPSQFQTLRTICLTPKDAKPEECRVSAVVGFSTHQEGDEDMELNVADVTQWMRDNTGEQRVICEALGMVPKAEAATLTESIAALTTQRDDLKKDLAASQIKVDGYEAAEALGKKRQRLSETIAAHSLGKQYGKIAAAVTPKFTSLMESADETEWPALLDDRVAALSGTAGQRPVSTLSEHRDAVPVPDDGGGRPERKPIPTGMHQRLIEAATSR